MPASPPPDEVLRRGRRRAADRADELVARTTASCTSRKDEDSGRVIVQVRDLDGHVIRTIPPSEALDVLSGATL